MRVLGEFVGVILAAVAGFFMMILAAAGVVVYFILGLISFLMMAASLVCWIAFAFDHTRHNLVNALGFLGEAAIPFVLIVLMVYYSDKLKAYAGARRQLLIRRSNISLFDAVTRDMIWKLDEYFGKFA